MNLLKKEEPIVHQEYDQRKQHWGSYIVAPNRPINNCTDDLLKKFNRAVEAAVSTPTNNRVLTQYSHRPCTHHLGVGGFEIHLDIFHTQLPAHDIESGKHDSVFLWSSQPVMQYQLIYTSVTGVIDIFTPEYSIQSILAHTFSHIFLCCSTVVMRSCSLMPLLDRKQLAWDVSEGIKSVDLVKVTLQDSEWNSRLQIDFPILEGAECTIYDHLQNCFNVTNPLMSELFSPIESTIMIHFHGSARPLRVSLSLPNQSNLRQHTDDDRMLVERCLARWGVLGDNV